MRKAFAALVVLLTACSSDPNAGPTGDAGATSCSYADASGVTRTDPGCAYVCDPIHLVDWCDDVHACLSVTSNGNCGACGVTCVTGQVCRQNTSGLYRCLAPR